MKKLPLKRQRKVIQLFNNLYLSGFNLTEMVDFLDKSQLLPAIYVVKMRESLLNGYGIAEMMASLGFSDEVVTQLSLADKHGNTAKSLDKIEYYLANINSVKKKLIEVGTYPLILVIFLVLIMLGLRNYLLPQLEGGESNLASKLISQFPQIFLAICLVFVSLVLVVYVIARNINPLLLYSFLGRLPFVGEFIRYYLSAYYAREWGILIGQGIELSTIVSLMQSQKSRLFRELGKDLELALLSGQSFQAKVSTYPFFRRELSLMIAYGEVKSKLGIELEVYAEESWEKFFEKVTKATQLIQPIVFILVAVIIVMIYAAMLLPMYQNMEVNI